VKGWFILGMLAVVATSWLAVLGDELSAQQSAGQVDERVGRLIEQLGDDDFFVRQRAQKELAKYSFEAFDALNAATAHEDLEIAARAKYLLRLMRVQWTTDDDPPEVRKFLDGYENQSDASKLSRMRALAALPDGLGVPALCRLVRYEKSPLLSKRAAIELIGRDTAAEDFGQTVGKALDGSRRPAAAWLMTYLRMADDPRTRMAEWTKLVEQEHALLRRAADQTSADIVSRLLRFQVGWLKESEDKEGRLAAMRKLIDLESGDPRKLVTLMDWLVEEEAWSTVDELAARFDSQLDKSPLLLYILAGAQLAQDKKAAAEATAKRALTGNQGSDPKSVNAHLEVAALLQYRKRFRWAAAEYAYVVDKTKGDSRALAQLAACLIELKSWKELDELARRYAEQFADNTLLLYTAAEAQAKNGREQLAEETARRALKLNPGKTAEALTMHLHVAYRLQHRGLFDWAEREFRHVIDTDAAGNEFGRTARRWLAEMLHDAGDDRRAAEVLVELEKAAGGPQAQGTKDVGSDSLEIECSLAEVRSRMNCFYASHFQGENDAARQREYLDKALAADPGDVDVLIACFRLPDKDEAYGKKIRGLIKRSADKMRREIAADPTDATPYNQFAWLIGNTEGDFDEALKFSKRSNQLRPNSGGYLDTLAHVYFGMGDYENAVKIQTRAAELDPHSGLIQRKLEVFKEKLQEKSKQ